MSCRLVLIAAFSLAFANPAFANWWIVRSSDGECLVVDMEPTSKDVAKVGKDVYQTREQAEADAKTLVKNQMPMSRASQETRSDCNSLLSPDVLFSAPKQGVGDAQLWWAGGVTAATASARRYDNDPWRAQVRPALVRGCARRCRGPCIR